MNLRYENKLWHSGYSLIAGLDEAGKGSWAGPLVAGIVVLPQGFKANQVRDSKLLSPKKRQELFLEITKQCIAWAVGVVPHTLIDEIGILGANEQAFRRAIDKLNLEPEYLILDGIKFFTPDQDHEFIIDGDNKVASVAAASIIAKVTRDKILEGLHKHYPEYNFRAHKGYGTEEHHKALMNHGLSEIHRLSFRPMHEIFESEF